MPESSVHLINPRVETLNRKLEGYRVLREIGHGAMGVVYEARQMGVDRRVALKVLPANLALRERTVRRFLREAAAMGRLSHANVVDIYEVESIGELHYFAMQFVEGPPLDKVLAAGPLAIADVVQIGIDVAGALAHAHGCGVMHRDIKPANLLRAGAHVVLTDFGLARPLDGQETGTMTESGDLVGTPLYMAPEQIRGETDRIDGRCDLWGLGVTLYELLAQRPPFRGASAQAILHTILQRDPALLRKLRDDVPPDLEAVVMKLLEKDPAHRYSGAAALLEDLDAVQRGAPVSARAPRFFDPLVRWVRRHPQQATLAAIMLSVVGFFGYNARESLRKLEGVREELSTTQVAEQEALEGQASLKEIQTEANAREELYKAQLQWLRGGEEDHTKALARLEALLLAYPIEEYPRIALQATEIWARWMSELVGDDEVVELFENQLVRGAGDDLALRAAMLTGLERYPQALHVHRERSLRDPDRSRPYCDAARVLLRMALAESGTGRDLRRRRLLREALSFLNEGLATAASAGEEETAVELLLDRATCYLDLGLRELATADLNRVLEVDETSATARSLLFSADERSAIGLAGGAPAQTALLSELAAETPLGGPTPELDTRDLEDAGAGLRLLFDGLRELIVQPAPEDGEGSEPTTDDRVE